MGLFRKLTSVSTLGLVDFRSDKERTAAYTRHSASEARKQTKLLRDAARQREQVPAVASVQPSAPPVPQGAPPAQWNGTVWQAWNAGANRWMVWDGQAWR